MSTRGFLKRLATVVLATVTGVATARSISPPPAVQAAPPSNPAAACVSDVLSGMSLPERVGQLFVAGVDSTAPTPAQLSMIRSRHLGGVILVGDNSSGVTDTRRVSELLQAQATPETTDGVALWIAADQEGGYVQDLHGPGFSEIPTALAQGDMPPATLRRRAAVWGDQLLSAGVNLNLAPVMDTVPASLGRDNEPIGYYYREYGHTPDVVRVHGMAFLNGMADARVQGVVKHFPGLGRVRGNTDTTDGVTDDVTTRHDPYLEPFAAAVDSGVPVVMVSSARYTRIDPDNLAVFSPTVLTGMLRGDLGYTGVIMSDDLGQAAAVQDIPAGQRAVRFLAAGGTVVLTVDPSTVPTMVDAVLARARGDAGFRSHVSSAARKVLATKWRAGLVPCPPSSSPIALHYTALGGSSSYLGDPIGPEYRVAGGRGRDYRRGTILWSSRTGARAVHGAILAHHRHLGGAAGVLGFPTTDERGTPDGVGRYNHFDGAGGASVYWTPGTGAHAVHGRIRDRWASLGWERSALGYPVTDERVTPDGVGRYNHFSRHGSIYWTPATGAWAVHGAIRDRWAASGWERGGLGYPVSNEYSVPGGRRSDFQYGSIVWDRSSNTTHVIHR